MAREEGRDAIVGLWKLLAYEDRESEAHPWILTFGQSPRGIILYHSTGLLTVQVFADEDSPSTPTYVGYLGHYEIREARREAGVISGIVEHKMEAASSPELLGEDFARPFTIAGNRLTLGDGRTWRRLLGRVM